MKQIILCMVILLLFSFGCDSDEQPIHLLTFNIRYDNPEDGVNRWENRVPIVERYFETEMPDIIGMQEVVHNQLIDLQNMLPGYDYVGTGREDGGTSGEYSPIFWKEERFDLVDHSQFWLSESPDEVGSRGWDAALPRIVTWAALEDTQTGRTIYTFNTHFDHRGIEARRNSIDLISDRISEIAADAPVIVTGDFNIRREHPAFGDTLYHHLLDTFRERHSLDNSEYVADEVVSAGATGNGFSDSWQERPPYAIDYIFANDHFDIQIYRVDHVIEGEVFISDHWPVAAIVSYQ